jgi:hypothetical protein
MRPIVEQTNHSDCFLFVFLIYVVNYMDRVNVCARKTTFLLDDRKRGRKPDKSRFPLVNRLAFETKRNVLKSTISES